MRSLKKLLAVVVAICVLATFTIPAFAADSATYANADQATKLNSMGLYAGISTTSFDPDLGSTLTREQGMVILLKMFGQLDAANAMTDADVTAALAAYTDASTLSSWAKKAFAYVVKNSISAGTSATTLDPKGTFTGNQFATLILKEAGYTVADWTTAAADLATKGVTGAGALATTVLTRDQLVGMAFGSLTVNNAAGKTIVAALVDAGKVTAAAAEAAGVYSATLSATASQTGAKVITVKFNRALTAAEKTAATVDVKNGLVAYTATATWAADNTSVALAYEYNYYAGDYTIKVGGITDPLKATVVDEKVSKLAIDNEYLPLDDNFDVTYKVYNQFNEEMSDVTNLVFSAFDATKAKGVIDTGVAGFQVDLLANGAAKDDTIILTVTHSTTGLSVTKSLKVSDISAPKALQFGTVAPLADTTRITVGDEGLTLPYTFTDQYGKAYKLPAHGAAAEVPAVVGSEVIGNVFFMSSDTSVVSPDTFVVDDKGVLTFNADGAGTAVISALVPATGVVATVTIKIEADAALKTFTMSNPGKLIAATETATVPYSAIDSFGAPIAQKDFTKAIGDGDDEVNFVSSNTTIVDATDIYFNGKHELLVPTLNKAGTVTIYAKVGGVLQGSITLDVKARAVPTKLTGLNDFPLLFQVGANKDMEDGNLKVIDQYNRAIDLKAYGDHTYTVLVSFDGADANKIDLTGGVIDAGTNVNVAGFAAGSQSVKFELNDNFNDGVAPVTDTVISTTKATFKAIADGDIKGYSLDTVPTLYGAAGQDETSLYAKKLTLLGKDASGNKVTIDQASIITAITSSNKAVVGTDLVTGKIFALKAGTATVAVWSGATKLAEVVVTAKDDAAYAVSAVFDPTSQALTGVGDTVALAGTITVKDQYDVPIADAGTWASSNTDVATVSNVGLVTSVAVGTATISYVTETGIVATVEVTVNP